MKYNSVMDMVGNTPVLLISPEIHGLKNIDLYAKLEYYNPFGSVKDRIAKGLLEPYIEEIKKSGKRVIEASSGNTAKALTALASVNGIGCRVISSRIKYPEMRQILQTLGADIDELPSLSDCPDPFDPNDTLQYTANILKTEPEKYHYTDQYYSELNPTTHYRTTGKELVDDLGNVDYFYSFLGTCGSTLGTGRYLREHNPQLKIYGIVAEAGHNIPGGRNMNELWEVGLYRREHYDDLITGDTKQAVEGLLTLNRKCGVMCGPTGGLAYYATVKHLKTIDEELEKSGERKTAVFIACDRVELYMSFLKQHAPEIFAGATTTKKTVTSLNPEEIATANIIKAEELDDYLAKKPLVIDIRGNFAYSMGHIPNSINILDEALAIMLESGRAFPDDKTIIITCRVGDISNRYAAFLKMQGYNAYSLEGGIQAYKKFGGNLEKSASHG
ncbi:MAG: pyridoxal-phosphate dependent enzyme [Alphaproteobacteria bacterium]